ncbi:4-hydroxy-tetrahydrodipicolinate reductase [Helicobacter sp. 13S00477-4]|uniref:4-hydroxy-tetrahydrodipicolinate reductase n=1 Tax=Helicobacter sp. 13S00477-4 TaxID=1905759 RepID=UPI000BA4F098|nr:4-hydroxy-tetrahydrodipicolinate reductase [Helicobacter sp. 13S00477-4]PAF52627.1 4-hydroxy-tetrahydrodipicolinate reductase [Helicobacter sp. 13S00477-4]
MLKIGIFGATGRIGRLLIEETIKDKELELGSVFVHKELAFSLPEKTLATNNFESFIQNSDLVIDFSLPEATHSLLQALIKRPIPLVSGTTGLDESTFSLFKELSLLTPLLYATNMSKGVAMLNRLLPIIVKGLDDSDIEISEIHHRYKKDAPSGTALSLANTCAKARGLDLSKVRISGRDGNIDKRKADEIGVMSFRGGDIAGKHTVGFYLDGEYLELTHNANSRLTFAKGAITAAKWLIKQKNGFYQIEDLFK